MCFNYVQRAIKRRMSSSSMFNCQILNFFSVFCIIKAQQLMWFTINFGSQNSSTHKCIIYYVLHRLLFCVSLIFLPFQFQLLYVRLSNFLSLSNKKFFLVHAEEKKKLFMKIDHVASGTKKKHNIIHCMQ